MTSWTPSPRPDDAIVGVRLFRVAAGGMLQSLNHGCGWLPGVNDAEPDGCRCNRSPGRRCHCGLNAFHSLEAAAGSSYRHYAQWAPAGRRVVAAVAGWGDIEVHADGWRAEHAQIVAIGAPDPDPGASQRTTAARDLAARAASRYGVPLVALDRLETYAREHGQPAGPEHLPDRRASQGRCDDRATPASWWRTTRGRWALRILAALQVAAACVALQGVVDGAPRVASSAAFAALLFASAAVVLNAHGQRLAALIAVAAVPMLLVPPVLMVTALIGAGSEAGDLERRARAVVERVAQAERALIAQGQAPRTPGQIAATRPDLRRAIADVGDVQISGAPGQGLRIVATDGNSIHAQTTITWPRAGAR